MGRRSYLLSAATLAAAAMSVGTLEPAPIAAASAINVVERGQTAAAAAITCSDAVVIGARGSGQAGDVFGVQVASLVTRLSNNLHAHGRTLTERPLTGAEYAAHHVASLVVDKLTPKNPYFDGIAKGVGATERLVWDHYRACPGERIVLAGYSQGAMVMHRVVLQLRQDHPETLNRIDGVVLIADGDRVRKTKTNLIGTAGLDGIGIQRWTSTASPPADITGSIASRTWSICAKWDIVCDTAAKSFWLPNPMPDGVDIHVGSAYKDSPWIRQVARQVAGEIRATPKPATLQTMTGTVGEPVNSRLTADVAHNYSLHWRLVLGATLPNGLTLASNGDVSGSPTGAGEGYAAVQVRSEILGVISSGWVNAGLHWTITDPGVLPPATGVVTNLTYNGDRDSATPTISADGKFVAFASNATNLTPGDDNGVADIFRCDLGTLTRTRISTVPTGTNPEDPTTLANPAISSDGRLTAYKAYDSWSGYSEVWVYDAVLGTTRKSALPNDPSGKSPPAIAGTNPYFITYSSDAGWLTPAGGHGEVYLGELGDSPKPPVAITHGNALSTDSRTSLDGRFVVYSSVATDLVAGDDNGYSDIFIFDAFNQSTTRVTAGNGSSYSPSISSDGRYVAFVSGATDLTTRDENGLVDVFLYDGLTTSTTLVTTGNGASFSPSISGDGRSIAFVSFASDLSSGHSGTIADIYLFDVEAGTISSITVGNRDSGNPMISADGDSVVFESLASNLSPDDGNGRSDVFLWQRAG